MSMKVILIALGLLVAVSSACHNSTGACTRDGKYLCLDGSHVPWGQRCDGREDCADGMDEFLCPRTAPGHHEVHEQASCGPSCACQVSTTTVPSTATAYFAFASYAPTWGLLMSGTPVNGLWGCNTAAGKTSSITMIWYKKGSSTCVGNTRRRGFICCGRQSMCICTTPGTPRCT